jgi:CheY-like chemotaxis protein
MQGTLTVDSALGTGSTFTLTLPLISANPISTSPNNHDPLPHIDLTAPPLTHDAVLIVDDQPTNCLVAQTILTKLGYRSEVAQSGSEALDRFRHRRYPLALIDIHMPDLDGYEVVRQIRELEHDRGLPHTPLIALTAKALASDRARCLAAGFDDYLPKPCTLDDYRRILSRWVGSSMSAGADDPLVSLRDALKRGDYPALRRLALALQQEAESHHQMARALIAASIAMQADKQHSDRIPALLAQLEQTYSSRDATTA